MHKELNSFPWPPPRPSTSAIVPIKFDINESKKVCTLGDVEEKINNILDNNGYTDKRYFIVPEGFAAATRLEQFTSNGKPGDAQNRWSTKLIKKFHNRCFSYYSRAAVYGAVTNGINQAFKFVVGANAGNSQRTYWILFC